jgi:glycosyltransferase involved in cell wall biosynthesis
MKLVAISRVKNEADIIEAFVRHHVQHFDRLIILDDGSTDATYGILQSLLAEGMPLTLLREASVGFEQNRHMTRLLHMAVEECGADWVAPLDADEFIEPEEEKALAQVLHGCERELFALPWSNFVWRPEDDQNLEINPVARLSWRISAQRDVHSHLSKVLVPANLLANGRTELSQGSHHLLQNGCALPTKRLDAVNLCHFPIRSVAQYASKVAVKYLQYSATANWMRDTGFHNIEPFRLLAEDVDQLKSHMAAYSRRYSLEDTQPPCEEPQEAPLHYMGGQLKYTVKRDMPLPNILHCAEAIALQSADFQRRNEALQHALEAAKSEGDHLQAELLQQYAESERLRTELSRLSAVHNETLATISWRITEPLRWIRRKFHLRADTFAARVFTYWKQRGTLVLGRKALEFIQQTVRQLPRSSTRRRANEAYRQILSRSERIYKSPDYCSDVLSLDFDPSQSRVKLFAFYLPQFHPIPENDLWWGKGFTEWTNVTRALPQFEGHDQPRLPADLGFYDLRNDVVLEQQVALAKKYGIDGFCFHFYWFAGKRLLEGPLDNFLRRRDLDLRFCLCWANENWTRRWDGQEKEVLIAQQHSPEDDIQVMMEMCKYIDDPRYLTVGDRPVVIVYRADLLPKAKETAERWRCLVKDSLGKDPFLVYAMTFDNIAHPEKFGFDAAVQFPPHCMERSEITSQTNLWNAEFSGRIYDYGDLAARAGARLRDFAFPVFPAVSPAWDNTPRRGSSSHVFAGSNPDLYSTWLSEAALFTADSPVHGSSIVFINAWNEWAEGAFLEPDQKYGHAFLRATAEALRPYCHPARGALGATREVANYADRRSARSVVVVTHDCHPHGAQFLALNLAKIYVTKFGFHVHVVMLGDGALKAEFAKVATCHDLSNVEPAADEALALACKLRADGNVAAICNSTVSGLFVAILKKAGIRTVSLIHELPGMIEDYHLQNAARTIAKNADRVIFPAEAVARGFEQYASISFEKRAIRPQGLYKQNRFRHGDQITKARAELRRRLGLSNGTAIVLAVGYADRRKGVDLFVEAGIRVLQSRNDTAFVWVGKGEAELMRRVRSRTSEAGVTNCFFFQGHEAETDIYYAGSDAYAMTSREDPFPSVILEALDAGLPVVAFADAGVCDLVAEAFGSIVPAFSTAAFADALLRFIDQEERRCAPAKLGRSIIANQFSFQKYAHDLLSFSETGPPRVSVVVPNYNYGHLLSERLKSITAQTHPVYELILLDDASSDDSLGVAQNLIEGMDIPGRIIANEQNSGSVFRQWLRGVEEATGDYVWIAEADDSSEPEFLADVICAFTDADVVMSYCQSKQMASDGRILCSDYLEYVSDISPHRWRATYVADGATEISQVLAVKNTIPNVSAVVFRRDTLLHVLRTHIEDIARFRIAGDWLTYTLLLECGKVAFRPRALNKHRRHESGVTLGSNLTRHFAEIIAMQQLVQRLASVAPATLAAADKYAQEIYVQFGLVSSRHPHFRDHPAVADAARELCAPQHRDASASPFARQRKKASR